MYRSIIKFSAPSSPQFFFSSISYLPSDLERAGKILKLVEQYPQLKKKALLVRQELDSLPLEHFVLDVAARVFSFQDPCTSLIKHDGKLKISYNDPAGHRLGLLKSLENKDELVEVLDKRIKDLILTTCKSLKNRTKDGKLDVLCTAIKHSSAYNDRWDSLEQILNGKLFIKQNDPDAKLYEVIKNFGDSLKDYKWPWNQSAVGIKKVLATKAMIMGIRSDEQLKLLASMDRDEDLVDRYFRVIDHQDSGADARKEVLENMLAVLADATKLHYHLELLGDVNSMQVEILKNDNKLHCEVNSLSQFTNEFAHSTNYIGISKLCCFLCEVVLSHYKVPHSGTHGLLFSYPVSTILEKDPSLATAIVTAFRKAFGGEENLEVFLKAKNLTEIKEVVDDIFRDGQSISQNQAHSMGKEEHMESCINDFHPHDLCRSLADYTNLLGDS